MSFNENDHQVAVRSHLARILWPLGYARRAADVAAEGVEKALAIGYPPNSCYVLTFAAIPIAFWSGDTAEAQRYIGLLREGIADLPHGYWHSWLQLFERIRECRRRPSQDQVAREAETIASGVKSPFIADMIATFGEDFMTDSVVERVATGETGWSAPEVLRGLGCRAVRAGEAKKAERLFLRSIEVARSRAQPRGNCVQLWDLLSSNSAMEDEPRRSHCWIRCIANWALPIARKTSVRLAESWKNSDESARLVR